MPNMLTVSKLLLKADISHTCHPSSDPRQTDDIIVLSDDAYIQISDVLQIVVKRGSCLEFTPTRQSDLIQKLKLACVQTVPDIRECSFCYAVLNPGGEKTSALLKCMTKAQRAGVTSSLWRASTGKSVPDTRVPERIGELVFQTYVWKEDCERHKNIKLSAHAMRML